jgi:type I restriction enzyme M protein
MSQAHQFAPVTQITDSVPDGMRLDFLTQRVVRDTPEEYVRQNLEQALVRQYKYQPQDCKPEFPIKVGSSRRRVDIAVFRPNEPQNQQSIDLIIETKRPATPPSSRTDGIEQLRSYMAACINVRYGMWTNGEERVCFAKRQDKNGFSFDEIADIPGYGQTEEQAQRPRKRDLRPATADNLLFAFRRCHNYIAANEGKQKPDAFWELLKIIFSKIEDERSRELNFYATAQERANSTGAISAKKRLDALFSDKVLAKYPDIFVGVDQEIDLRPTVAAYVVSQLQSFALLASPVDVKGVAYEEVVGSNLRGDRGEFFTPRNACRMAVHMLNPQPSERILDPACGTGGFLTIGMNQALEYIRREHEDGWVNPTSPTEEERGEYYRARQEYLRSNVLGIDINPALVRAAKMNMVMNNDGEGGLWRANSLANPHTWVSDLAARVPLGGVDVVVSNPPFGANIRIDDTEVLSQYDLAAVWEHDGDRWVKRRSPDGKVQLQKSQPPEILFIERCLQFLKPGGRMAIVLPNGILNNPALGYVRSWLLNNAQVLAVVDMARELFQPNNDTQTSMLILRRLSDDERALAESRKLDYPVFMAIAERVGQDRRGNVIYRRDEVGDDVVAVREETLVEVDADGHDRFVTTEVRERVIDDDLPDIAVEYRRWLART